MTEKNTSSIVDTFPDDIHLYPEKYTDIINNIENNVLDYMHANNIDIDSVVFAGFNKVTPKQEGSEHWEAGKTPNFYFGTKESLKAPTRLSDDPEIQGEHWSVNPIKYALMNGTLGIYDKEELGSPIDIDEEFGTLMYEKSPEIVESARIAEIEIKNTN